MPEVSRPSFEDIAEAIAHIVWLADESGSTDYFNIRGTDFTGMPRQANYGWEWVKLVHPNDADRARLGWEHATRTATPFELSYRIRRSDGDFRWHAFRALPVRGPDGHVLKWIGTADEIGGTDPGVDDETRAERQIAELRSMLQVVQEQPAQRFGHVDRRHLTRRVNELTAAADATGPHRGPTAVPAALGELTARELAVLRLVAGGYTNTEIANLLGYSLRTIESSRARLRAALGMRARSHLVRFARDAGLAPPTDLSGPNL
jgi:PAS domain S-box-containing protein